MKFLLLAILFLSFGLSPVSASEISVKNAGFVPSNIWYSKEQFFAGDTVRIYTIVFNGSAYDLSGTIEFLDNGTVLGETDFALSGGGRVRDAWIDWKATEGKHLISARIVDAHASLSGGSKRLTALENTETGESERVIDLDTDSDGVGNTDDPDDDGDSISDVDELRNGSDPLKKDTDGDGVADDKELALAVQQTEEADESSSASSTEPLRAISSALEVVSDYIPVTIKTGTEIGVDTVERFRIGQGYRLRLAKEEKAREIEALKARAAATTTALVRTEKEEGVLEITTSAAEKPFAYVMLASLTALQYAFDWKIIFYGVSLYVLYRSLKWVIRRVRDR